MNFSFLTQLFVAHPYMSSTVTTLFVSSAVGAMPSPLTNTGFYRWFFDFIHTFTGGVFRVLASRSAVDQNLQVKTTTTETKTLTNVTPGGSIK
jgi:hypothetical protein